MCDYVGLREAKRVISSAKHLSLTLCAKLDGNVNNFKMLERKTIWLTFCGHSAVTIYTQTAGADPGIKQMGGAG